MRNRPKLPLEALRPFEVELPFPAQHLDLQALFGNASPVELEVGFGKGTFLLAQAERRPECNYLGIEIDRGLERYAATRIAKRGWSHVKVACGDAAQLLEEYLLPLSLQAVHIYCPDPWWKKRHHKRRVFTANFARLIEQRLIPGGELHLGSDVAAYFALMTELVRSETALVPRPVPPVTVATNFELKAERAGKRIWRGAYTKEK